MKKFSCLSIPGLWWGPAQALPPASLDGHVVIVVICAIVVVFVLLLVFLLRIEVQHKTKSLQREIDEHRKVEEELASVKERYQMLFSKASEGIMFMDTDGRIIGANEAYAAMHGYSIDEIKSMNIRQLVVPHVGQFFQERVARIMKGETVQFESEHVRKDGSTSLQEVSASYITIGGEHFIQSFSRDITERRRLALASNYLKAIVDSAEDAIIGKDLDGNVTSWNLGAARMFGYSASEMLGTSILRLIPAERHDEEQQILHKLRQGETMGHFETVRRKKDGGMVEVSVTASPIKDIYGRVVGVSKVVRDISQRKILEKLALEVALAKAAVENADKRATEIEAAYQELKRTQGLLIQSEKMSAIGVMSAGIAHELNNPLTVILTLARDHLVQDEPAGASSDYRNIALAGERMARIIRGLLDFSRPSSGQRGECNGNEMIEGVLGYVQKIMMGPNVEVQKDYGKDLPPFKVDRNRLEQLVIILIGNAVDAMDKKGVLKIATRRVLVEGKAFVEIEFTDSGCGIKAEDVDKIFDPFYTTKRPGKGTGLGLSVANAIIKEHHGEISVESPPAGQAHGATFKVRLPAASGAGADEGQG